VAKGTPSSFSCFAPTSSTFTPSAEYILDLSGNQMTEVVLQSGVMTWAHTNVWLGSQLTATYDAATVGTNLTPALHFHFADPLGSRRVQTNPLGTIENSYQSLPFGNGQYELSNSNCIIANSCYSADASTEHHFTGKERDIESGNDYFPARYYSSNVGRWLSPDPSGLALASPVDPQSFNLYAYVSNHPLVLIDPFGLENCLADGCDPKSPPPPPPPSLLQRIFSHIGGGDNPDNDTAAFFLGYHGGAQQQNALQTAGQRAASGPYGSNVISVSGNTTTLPLYNGPNSSAEIIGTQVVTDNLNSNGSGTIKIVNTNQSIEGSPTETITMRLKNGLPQSTSVRTSDGSVNMDSSTSFSSRTGQATVTMVNHNSNTVNIRVYDTSGGSGPVLRSDTTYNTTWVY
jgi:RHS repeat-associated protein